MKKTVKFSSLTSMIPKTPECALINYKFYDVCVSSNMYMYSLVAMKHIPHLCEMWYSRAYGEWTQGIRFYIDVFAFTRVIADVYTRKVARFK